MRQSDRLGAGGDNDGPLAVLSEPVVGGVEDTGGGVVSPAGEDARVLLPQGQHGGDLLHADPLGHEVVVPAHGFGGEDRPGVLAGGPVEGPGVAASGEVFDGLLDEGKSWVPLPLPDLENGGHGGLSTFPVVRPLKTQVGY